MSIFDDLNNFITRLLTVKSSDFRSLFFNGTHSKSQSRMGINIHLLLINYMITPSDAILPAFPNMALAKRGSI